ncbi:protein-methionine-sulfoxide reductase catalytic subunit MsrP [Helicobacter mustelae]|uniref:Protein-methionine-sulfoxide reductase catalytic subunit MsrP n=1 Tax=Helicobacter mustelae (strain ATCC 43772 / CCUG 25715 / CIP 103759 / LMG 18044 / NCTC 12198 / R85-136P) TaxID=679897 RepID=D3UGA7_HELM1|nr:protein-methionine-sulfoxide reductase catalytic subunit MsrP [Helicobacter mustelae]CBG39528.1 putative molybdopterin-binding oxidoreductase [Helicobacter mustelae 12198]SQH71039.1 molybdopterin-binding oxidoreductase [Helicobacter mustelae]
MWIGRKKSWEIGENEVSDEGVYQARRKILRDAALLGLGNVMFGGGLFGQEAPVLQGLKGDAQIHYKQNKNYVLENITPYEKASTYNNFYEFGMQKDDPARYASVLQTSPWDVVIDGEVQNPMKISIEKILRTMPLEERIYRFRCVEAWSMNIPWVGFELRHLLSLAKPMMQAKYVVFESAKQESMPAVKNPRLVSFMQFPYIEGLRIDEAMHPLTLLSVGMYGRKLPNQNGAPLRLVVPWKYGFKNIKSIVRITLTKDQPTSTWEKLAANEYGFYANVNPDVPHPRWSQASERFIGEGFSLRRQRTQMFNGYGEEVARLYANLNLEKNY